MKSEIFSTLKQGLIVSCQAPVDSPLHDPIVIAAMAKAAVNRGAVGVRIDTPTHIEAVRQQVSEPIIGLWEQQTPGFDVYITPDLKMRSPLLNPVRILLLLMRHCENVPKEKRFKI